MERRELLSALMGGLVPMTVAAGAHASEDEAAKATLESIGDELIALRRWLSPPGTIVTYLGELPPVDDKGNPLSSLAEWELRQNCVLANGRTFEAAEAELAAAAGKIKWRVPRNGFLANLRAALRTIKVPTPPRLPDLQGVFLRGAGLRPGGRLSPGLVYREADPVRDYHGWKRSPTLLPDALRFGANTRGRRPRRRARLCTRDVDPPR